MVSFSCDACGDVVTRKKLDSHLQRCGFPPITCIDCHATFHGSQHKSHTSCVTEAQKYEGHLYRPKQDRRQNTSQPPKPPRNGPNSHYRAPTVQDAAEEPTLPTALQVAKVHVPPAAPSPPQSQPTPLNVFDFLVSERSPAASHSSAPSSPMSPVQRRASFSSPMSSGSSTPASAADMKPNGVSYGSGPVPRSFQKYPSELSLGMDVDSRASQAAVAARTPGPRRPQDSKSSLKSGSEKKRKRPPVEELDLSDARNSDDNHALLHTGLTGGLGKLLARSDLTRPEASPLSPKKRSKHSRDAESVRAESSRKHTSRRLDKDRTDKPKNHSREDKPSRRKAIEAAPKLKAIASAPADRNSHDSHSEFFLSLIDKTHKSQKGQSIWGTLKTFHDGLCDDSDIDSYEADGRKQHEEKRLLKALRVKRNKVGELVLFALPEYEDTDDGPKLITAS